VTLCKLSTTRLRVSTKQHPKKYIHRRHHHTTHMPPKLQIPKHLLTLAISQTGPCGVLRKSIINN